MTINQAIELLEKFRNEGKGEINVYFDCPKCNISFTPKKIIQETVHFPSDSERK